MLEWTNDYRHGRSVGCLIQVGDQINRVGLLSVSRLPAAAGKVSHSPILSARIGPFGFKRLLHTVGLIALFPAFLFWIGRCRLTFLVFVWELWWASHVDPPALFRLHHLCPCSCRHARQLTTPHPRRAPFHCPPGLFPPSPLHALSFASDYCCHHGVVLRGVPSAVYRFPGCAAATTERAAKADDSDESEDAPNLLGGAYSSSEDEQDSVPVPAAATAAAAANGVSRTVAVPSGGVMLPPAVGLGPAAVTPRQGNHSVAPLLVPGEEKRQVVEKMVGYVAKNGQAFEDRVRKR